MKLVCRNKYVPENYLLRWRFDYHDKPCKYGAWSNPGNTRELQAWCQTKEMLSMASIEGKHKETRQVVFMAKCDGWDFVNFEWTAAAPIPLGGIGKGISVEGSIQGLVLVTREKRIEILIDGTRRVRERTEGEKSQHLAGFGR